MGCNTVCALLKVLTVALAKSLFAFPLEDTSVWALSISQQPSLKASSWWSLLTSFRHWPWPYLTLVRLKNPFLTVWVGTCSGYDLVHWVWTKPLVVQFLHQTHCSDVLPIEPDFVSDCIQWCFPAMGIIKSGPYCLLPWQEMNMLPLWPLYCSLSSGWKYLTPGQDPSHSDDDITQYMWNSLLWLWHPHSHPLLFTFVQLFCFHPDCFHPSQPPADRMPSADSLEAWLSSTVSQHWPDLWHLSL